MQHYQTIDPLEARTCRRAQFAGIAKQLTLNGTAITGLVHAVREDVSLVPTRWTVTIIPQEIPAFRPTRAVATNRHLRAGR